MAKRNLKFVLEIDERYTAEERRAIAQEAIDFIINRTKTKNVDKNNRPFQKYSVSYTKSLDFKNAGKSKGDVNLSLSGDMLASMELLSSSPGKIEIGYSGGSPERDKAEGNILGTYGNKQPVTKPRDFLGISKNDFRSNILTHYPLNSEERRDLRTKAIQKISGTTKKVVAGATLDEEFEFKSTLLDE